MIKIEINGKQYNLKTGWQDITIREAKTLMGIKPPDRLLQYWRGECKESDFTTRELTFTLPAYFGDVLCLMADIPTDVMQYVQSDYRIVIFTKYCKDVVSGLWTGQPFGYTPTIQDSFKWKGTTYHLPHSQKVFGAVIPFYDTKMVRFIEIADLQTVVTDMQTDMLQSAAMFCSVCVREDNEAYSEEGAILRGQAFEELPMSLFWEVFFSLQRLGIHLLNVIPSYLSRKTRKDRRRRILQNLLDLASGYTFMKSLKHKYVVHGKR